jgi:GTP-binding protein
MALVDKAVIRVQSGSGGNGAISFRHEMFVPKGGPDGGDGGGSVFLEVDPNLGTLRDFSYNRHFKAGNGANGMSKQMSGLGGTDSVVKVPPGTLVYDEETGELLADLIVPGAKTEILKGGKGGKGNMRFATSTRQAPRIAEHGEPCLSKTLRLELKLLADIGLIGFPNAGKSTLLSALTKAQPKIANYPFTTLSPNLGVMALGDCAACTIADMPGLIEGAHQGKGLGTRFLRHIERTRVLVFVVDATVADPVKDYEVLLLELEQYDPGLLSKPRVVAFNKTDLLPAKAKRKPKTLYISAKGGTGLDQLKKQIARQLKKA